MRAVTLCALLLAACGQGPGEAPARQAYPTAAARAAPQPAPPPGRQLASTADIRGQWHARVGAEPILVSILSDELHAVSGCVRWNWRLGVRGSDLTLARAPSATPPCARPLTKGERAFEQALDRTTRMILTPDGELLLWGPASEAAVRLRRRDDTGAATR